MISEVDILLRLGLAALFGSFIGLERERQFWAAGLRTHMMVSVGACLFMIVSNYAAFEALNSSTDPRMRFDPTRIAAQVVTGIGFIGAGTILFVRKGIVRGLTTAAGLWTVSAIGLATGGGMFVAAGATTAIALIILWLFKPIENMVSKKHKYRELRVVTNDKVDNNELYKSIMEIPRMKVYEFTYNRNEDGFVYIIRFEFSEDSKLKLVIDDIRKNPNITEIDLS